MHFCYYIAILGTSISVDTHKVRRVCVLALKKLEVRDGRVVCTGLNGLGRRGGRWHQTGVHALAAALGSSPALVSLTVLSSCRLQRSA